MENRTSLNFTVTKAVFFEAVLTRNGFDVVVNKDTTEGIQRVVNSYLQDNYELKTLEKVERDQIKL